MKTLPLLLPKYSLQNGTTNPIMQLSLKLPILSNSNTSNYILITLNQRTLHALFTKSSTLKIGDNPCINLSPSPYNTAQAPKTSIPPTHIGITNMHGLMPSSYKIKIIAILGSSTFTIP